MNGLHRVSHFFAKKILIEQYPVWLAAMKYDGTKSLRENYIDNALKPYSQNGTVYTLAQQQQRLELEESKKRDVKDKDKKKKKQTNWRDHIKFIL